MKTGTIIRIIAWAVVALLLIGVLIAGISGHNIFNWSSNNSFSGCSINIGSSYANADSYLAGNGSVNATGINDIEINWVSGSVIVETYDGDTINFTEDYIDKDEQRLRYLVSGSKLTIQFCKAGLHNLFGENSSKHLTVQIPNSTAQSLDSFKADTVSATSNVKNITAKTINFDTVSGSINMNSVSGRKCKIDAVSGSVNADNITFDEVDTDSISGSVTLIGCINKLSSDSVSGDINLDSTVCPNDIETDTTSGDVKVRIPAGSGFTAEHDATSGDMNISFQSAKKGDKYISGDGSAHFEFDSVSGDVTINER